MDDVKQAWDRIVAKQKGEMTRTATQSSRASTTSISDVHAGPVPYDNHLAARQITLSSPVVPVAVMGGSARQSDAGNLDAQLVAELQSAASGGRSAKSKEKARLRLDWRRSQSRRGKFEIKKRLMELSSDEE